MKFVSIRSIIKEKISGEWGEDSEGSDGVIVVRTANFLNIGKVDFSKLVRRNIEPQKVEKKKLENGDVIIEKSGGSPTQPVGRVVLFQKPDEETYLCNNFTSVLRPDRALVSPEYFLYVLMNNHRKGKTLRYQNKTTGIINLQLDKYLDSTIPLPSLEDQVRIAHLLGKVEGLIAQRKKDLSQLDQLLKSVFLEMFGDPVRNEKGWEKNALSKITEQVVDCPHSTPKWTEEGVICLRTSNLGHGAWNWDDTRYVDEIQYQQRISRSEILPADIILSREGTVGVLALVSEGMKLCMGQRLVQVRANQNKIAPLFLLHLLLMELAPERIRSLMAGSTSQHLNMKDLRALGCMVPPLILQTKFSTIVEKLENTKSKYHSSLGELETLYGVLSQKAFQGELDLSRVLINTVVQLTQPFGLHADPLTPTIDTTLTESEGDSPRHVFTRKDIESALQKLDGPQSFPKLLAELEKVATVDRNDYEGIRALVYQMLNKKQLAQVFDETNKEKVTVAGKTKEDAVPMRLKLL